MLVCIKFVLKTCSKKFGGEEGNKSLIDVLENLTSP